MSINIADNFKYLGKKYLDSRQLFSTLLEMKNCNNVPAGFVTFCKEDGKRYEYLENESIDDITGKWREYKVGVDESMLNFDFAHVGDKAPEDDELIWFDNGGSNSTEITFDNPIINELFACIRTLQDQVKQLQADVEYLKINGGGGGTPLPPIKPDDPPESVVVALALEDGGLFMLEDGGFMILEESVAVSTLPSLSLEDGGLFMLENGGFMILENAITDIDKSLMLLENGAHVLLENGANMLLENI